MVNIFAFIFVATLTFTIAALFIAWMLYNIGQLGLIIYEIFQLIHRIKKSTARFFLWSKQPSEPNKQTHQK